MEAINNTATNEVAVTIEKVPINCANPIKSESTTNEKTLTNNARRSKRKAKKPTPTDSNPAEANNKPKKPRPRKKTIPKSLNEETGQFYVCHCMQNQKTNHILPVLQEEDLRNLTSDTETASETEKRNQINSYYCKVCSNGYQVKNKLEKHEKVHKTFCKLCDKKFKSLKLYKEHLMKHVIEKFVCHYCEKEFLSKPSLMQHFEEHLKNDMFDSVLKLEDDYNMNSANNDFSAAYINYNNSYYSRALPSFETEEKLLENAKFSTIAQNYADYYNNFIFPSDYNKLAPTTTEPIYCYTCDINLCSWFELHQHMNSVHNVNF